MILSYGDIQEFYDKELRENADWSVFVLPRSHEYFNTFLPPNKRYNSEDTHYYLSQISLHFVNDRVEQDLARRLLGLYTMFRNIEWGVYYGIVDDVVESCNSNQVEFDSNAVARSVRNPYYRFHTHTTNPERQKIRREHRRTLKDRYSRRELDKRLFDELANYDLNNGLLTRDYLYDLLDINRHYLNLVFSRNNELKLMFEYVKNQSKTK